MKNNKIVAGFCVVALAIGLTACGEETVSNTTVIEEEVVGGSETTEANTSASEEVTEKEKENGEGIAAEEGERIYGEITSINGSEITIALAEMPMGGRPEGGAPEKDGAGRKELPEGAGEGVEVAPEGAEEDMEAPPEGGRGERMDSAEGGKAGKGVGEEPRELPEGTEPPEMPEITLTGEERTVTVSEETQFSIDGEAAMLNDMKVGDMVTILMYGEQVISVEIRNFQPQSGDFPQGNPPQEGETE